MRRLACLWALGTAALALAYTLPPARAATTDPLTVSIQIAPSTLLLNSSQGGSITVHTDISYSKVARGSVALNGVAASATFADLTGCLVAKVPEVAIKRLVSPPSAKLTLTGLTTDRVPFAGSATVRVIVRRK